MNHAVAAMPATKPTTPDARAKTMARAFDMARLTSSLSGRLPHFTKRRERRIASRSRRKLIRSHGRSKRWLEPENKGDNDTTRTMQKTSKTV